MGVRTGGVLNAQEKESVVKTSRKWSPSSPSRGERTPERLLYWRGMFGVLSRQSETYVYRHRPAPPGCLPEFGDKILQSGDGVLEFEFSSAAPPAKPSKCHAIQAPEVHNGEKYARDKKYLVY